MSFNQRVLLICLLVIVGAAGFWWWYRERSRPQPAPLPPRPEVPLTIIPGWNLRQIANYLVTQGFASSTGQVFAWTGEPARWRVPALAPIAASGTPDTLLVWADKPSRVSWEGYLAPQTIRVYADASLASVLEKFIRERQRELVEQWQARREIAAGAEGFNRSWHEILTIASLIEKEAKFEADRAPVADILWRRYQRNWALQVDSSVHYAVNKIGTVFTTARDRQVASPWNTYRYPGLPPGPISNPGLASIKAVLNPQPNNYWYWLSGRDGKIYYARTLPEHNQNKKYL
ncbi:MAG: endolytic transglycosylase MltG [Candidatus Magasanikbacteria bacterium]|nr:endolytic transglycosylase MltG [Candidatus Magasanikbacteria bacterium]